MKQERLDRLEWNSGERREVAHTVTVLRSVLGEASLTLEVIVVELLAS